MADATVLIVGMQVSVPEEQVEALEDRSHPLIRSARDVGLQFYWGSPSEDAYCLMVRRIVARLGPENDAASVVSPERLRATLLEVSELFSEAGIREAPSPLAQYLPD